MPIGIVMLITHPPTLATVAYALTAGVLSSAVPFLMDVLALRRVPAQFFGVFMSVNPVLAALVGLVMLHQQLDHWSWAAIGRDRHGERCRRLRDRATRQVTGWFQSGGATFFTAWPPGS